MATMKLDDWLWTNKTRRSAFAQIIEVDPSYVTHLINGKIRPSIAVIQRIDKATAGEVQARDFYSAEVAA